MPMLAAVAYRHVVEQLLHWDEFEPSQTSSQPIAIPDGTDEHEKPHIEDSPSPTSPVATPPPAPILETVRAPEPDPLTNGQIPFLDVVEAISGLLASLEEREMARQAPRVVAEALRADVSALIVVDEEEQQAGVIGGYDNIAQAYLPMTVLELSKHPTIVNALGRLRQMRLTTQRNRKELRDLYENLGIMHDGPAYLQPLVDGDDRLGILVVGSPYSERFFSNEERNLLDRLAPLVSAALLNAEKHQDLQEELDRVIQSEGNRLANISDELTAAQAELNAARRQMTEMKAYIRDMHRQLQSGESQQEATEQQTENLLNEVEKLREQVQDSDALREQHNLLKERFNQLLSEQDALKALADEVETLREDNSRLLQQAQQRGMDMTRLEEERAVLTQGSEQITRLQVENEHLQKMVKDLQTQLDQHQQDIPSDSDAALLRKQYDDLRNSAQMEIASLRTRLTQAAISQQEVIFLQEQLGIKTREAVSLQTRLTEADASLDALRKQVSSTTSNLSELEALTNRIGLQASEIARLKADLTEARAGFNLDDHALQVQQGFDQIDRQALSELEIQLDEKSSLITSLETQLGEKSKALVELKAHMSEVDNSLRNLERQLGHKNEEVEHLQATLNQIKQKSEERITSLQTQIEDGSADSSTFSTDEFEALNAELEEREGVIHRLERQIEQSHAEITELERKLSETTTVVSAAMSEAQQVDSS